MKDIKSLNQCFTTIRRLIRVSLMVATSVWESAQWLSYPKAIVGLNRAGYWPMHRTTAVARKGLFRSFFEPFLSGDVFVKIA
jgi:hypothetical protein